MLAPIFNNGATQDGTPRGGGAVAGAFPPQRAKRGYGLLWFIVIVVHQVLNG